MNSGIHELNTIVDDIFRTLEEIRALFQNWTPSSSLPFIHKVMYLNVLRERLYRLGFDDDFTETVIKVVYNHVFSEAERLQHAGKWYITV
jgi:hypothetical protein